MDPRRATGGGPAFSPIERARLEFGTNADRNRGFALTPRPFIAVDLGGTRIRAAVVTPDGARLARNDRLTPTDLLTIAARAGDDRSMLGPPNDDAQTIMITVRGSDLTAYLSGQIDRDEARQRMTVRVF